MTRPRGKVTISSTVSGLADVCLDKMVGPGMFSTRSNAVETSTMLMFFVLNNEQIMEKAKEMGIV